MRSPLGASAMETERRTDGVIVGRTAVVTAAMVVSTASLVWTKLAGEARRVEGGGGMKRIETVIALEGGETPIVWRIDRTWMST